jgi:hypothetical protein
MVYCVPVAVIRQIWRMLAVESFGWACLTGPERAAQDGARKAAF